MHSGITFCPLGKKAKPGCGISANLSPWTVPSVEIQAREELEPCRGETELHCQPCWFRLGLILCCFPVVPWLGDSGNTSVLCSENSVFIVLCSESFREGADLLVSQ